MLARSRAPVWRVSAPGGAVQQVRRLNLHEYQSKSVMEKFNVNVQRGKEATSAAAAGEIARKIKAGNPGAELIVKAQIHAGGRGKGTFKNGFKGGVKVLSSPEEVELNAGKMLGQTLVTHQTGPEGQQVRTVLVNEGISIKSEKYLAILMDRASNGPVIVASAQGGMDIEEVAAKNPKAIIKEPIDIRKGLLPAQTLRVAKAIGFKDANVPAAQKQIANLYDLFLGTDATQVEINPFAEGQYVGDKQAKEEVFCVDAKLNFDDNASFRQKDIFAMRDRSMEDPRDVAASDVGLNYIGLDGNIGCLVNGAGLAMATMDIIKQKGGEPANFLDVGGGATAEMVASAFRIITSDARVKGLLINIFGGIMRCDVIATGIVQAIKEVGLKIPLVVRLEGTNVELGKKILRESGLAVVTADNLDDAATKCVAAIKGPAGKKK
jgi:succinyl-CoA synthetase beta subunit